MDYASPADRGAEDFIARWENVVRGGGGGPRSLDDELERMPRTDALTALDVYTRLARSEHPVDREAVAVRIDLLLAVDRDAAAPLWRTLLADSEQIIRRAAYETLELARDEVESGSADFAALAKVVPPAGPVREA